MKRGSQGNRDRSTTGGGGRTFLLSVFAGVLLFTPGPASAQMETRYTRAERLLAWNIDPYFTGDQVSPQWMRGGNRFWYRNKVEEGAEFILVDPVANTRGPLFDRHLDALYRASGEDRDREPNDRGPSPFRHLARRVIYELRHRSQDPKGGTQHTSNKL